MPADDDKRPAKLPRRSPSATSRARRTCSTAATSSSPAKDGRRPARAGVLLPLAAAARRRVADRLDLARWLVDPANPLTPRVAVNHVWQHLFGRPGRARRRTSASAASRRRTPNCSTGWPASSSSARLEPQGADPHDRHVGHLPPGVAAPAGAGRASIPSNRLLAGRTASASRRRSSATCTWPRAACCRRRSAGRASSRRIPKDLAKITFRSELPWKTSPARTATAAACTRSSSGRCPYPNLMTSTAPTPTRTVRAAAASPTRRSRRWRTLNDEVFVEAAPGPGPAHARHRLGSDAERDRLRLPARALDPAADGAGELDRLLRAAADQPRLVSRPPRTSREAGSGDTPPDDRTGRSGRCVATGRTSS